MYCSKCGAKLPEGARFCQNCGAQVQAAGDAAQGGAPPQPYYPPVKQRPKWLIPVVVSASVLAAVLMLVVIVKILTGGLMDNRAAEPESSVQVEVVEPAPEFGDEPAESFERYENHDVMFAIDYPGGFEFSEPNANNVLFGSGDQCRVAVEYAYMTTGNCFIYSAGDFIDLMSASPQGLSDWIGAAGAELLETREEEYGGQPCTALIWELSQNGMDYDGALYVFDSQGDFGCYTILTMVERGSENEAAFREDIAAMLQSFQITGPYEAEGIAVHGAEELGLRFALQEDRIEGRIDIEDDHVLIVPAGETFSHSSIRIQKETTFTPEKHTAERTLEGCSGYYIRQKDNGRYISEPTQLAVGRYDFSEVDVQYTESGEEHVASVIIFRYGGDYWRVTMVASESNLDVTREALGDVLVSLDLGGEISGGSAGPEPDTGEADKNQIIDEILTKIEGTDGFIGPDGSYEPLASFTDIDGNGVNELLVLYKVKKKGPDGHNVFRVQYDVYSVEGGSYKALAIGSELYEEVGGNSGTIGLAVDKAMKPYLKVETKSPQGDRFNDSVIYIPWNDDQSDFDDYTVYFERHGVYGEEDRGEYIAGDTKVDRESYEARQTEFMSLWTDLNLNMGPGNGGNNMSFEQIRFLDMNDYVFNFVN